MQRFIPLSVKIRALFSSINSKLALPLLAGVVIAVFFLGGLLDWKSLKFTASAELKLAPGRVYSITRTGVSVNKRQIFQYHYRYRISDAETLSGASYMTGYRRFGTNTVPVEYLAAEPDVSRIRGMRTGILSPFFSFLLLPVFGIGVFHLFRAVRKGQHLLSVLGNGEITSGRFVGETTTGTRINKRRVMACTFEYEVNQQKYRMTARTHRPEVIKDQPEEQIVYNTEDPSRAVLLDLLPRGVRAFIRNKD